MMKRPQPLFLFLVLITALAAMTACAPRPDVIETSAGATLTAMVPTSSLPQDRATSTAVPTLLPPTEPPTAAAPPTSTPTSDGEPPSVDATTTPDAPTATPLPALPVTGETIFQDTFDSAGPWSVGDTADALVAVEAGYLRFVQKTTGRFSFRVTGRTASDFYGEVTSLTEGPCRQGDRYGLMFRIQDFSNYYVFLVDCVQRHRAAVVSDGTLTYLYDWTNDAAINGGANASNVIGVAANGSDLRFYVNDEQVGQVADSTFSDGRFGIWIGAELTANFGVRFDNLTAFELLGD